MLFFSTDDLNVCDDFNITTSNETDDSGRIYFDVD